LRSSLVPEKKISVQKKNAGVWKKNLFLRFGQAIPGFLLNATHFEQLVCIPDVIAGLAAWRHNSTQKKKRQGYEVWVDILPGVTIFSSLGGRRSKEFRGS